ncbi:outer membrane beta-barrel protein [Bacteroides sp. UBA939]|uniref:outer membrane beta-barrel protein n=1 Tax=Bacteroides sp. UBA939 TaxID=1946092 RepID=UPI0025C21FF2|nr:outer membrane beta-barrel protein [Bacteroides sp. UBA939]
MMKDDELWLKKIKERLEDYSEPLPVSGWERLEKALPSAPPKATGMSKRIVFRRWAVAAVAAVLVAVSSVSLWLMRPVVDDVRRSAEPALVLIPDGMPEPVKPAAQTEQSEPVIRRMPEQRTPNRQLLVAQQLEKENTDKQTTEVNEKGLVQQDAEDTKEEMKQETTEDVSSISGKKEKYHPSNKDKLHLPIAEKSSTKNKGWALGLSVGNTGGLSILNNGMNNDMGYLNSSNGLVYADKLDLSNTVNGVYDIPEDQELVFENGVPYLRKSVPQIQDIKHKQPVSFGISVRKALPKGFSVETGLTYTMLSSEITYERSAEKVNQKLHYVGIPVRANWSFVNEKRVNVYMSAGGAIEKCVYGKIGSDKETVKPLQFSIMGAVGAQYNVSNRVGLYVEPGVSYFFDDGSAIETIRKDSPTNFTLQAGIRLTY